MTRPNTKIDLMFDEQPSGRDVANLLRKIAHDIEAYSAAELVDYRNSTSTAAGVAHYAFFADEDEA